ncbi:bifunctional diaminohydroxyphosphoribosylaminopyrimidine deaminase/5-amino-6-(5-phosphoribosylamino)uracil reductase RibD [Flavobacterium sp.]|uniref:bifunctional diaminohydroxyphosphoribosylaminopyrimidine deaminase/5-amino-6-(5-phosphoribosylamino)uracil reductase RibD n=1 Tax=Flavobacterium sp. TaxID=239 RepID=UPI0022BBC7E7|nr:bifunctional diaminohydroxyphosphoribosylaminopyrimidine deaminase/5-amino-6-(5-phosphoribosylamino)uracil reductase RibD [Flavobacterium sp.]MCZ8144908.1 bifunctional diaminohydroxyphosphoribosylaminopyrimidine deaminase/5-amino-6-(5-phosphoribosylamino)uracil reductase RibD [Flavobacterium sp.]MCZ8366011.1 bifunctional diaminohydroxyphosphoribosylaminopyrimidine deaminase/5-amino-6-(5-phosphoribosylamino)uracil reductase RibD [Flavobacterium sp.]
MKIHEKYMQRCLQLAENGLGSTYPNPMVGSVIVQNDRIIGEGWHRKAGEPHAEVIAVRSVKNPELLKEATIYVSLEPCNHFGKTPPCSDLILEKGIPTVVVGTVDPFAAVAGRGIQKLREAGRTVVVGVLERECQSLNRRFFTFHNEHRPYILLKWAQTADGFIAPLEKEAQKPVWISNAYARQKVHQWRSEEQAILVGTKTVVDDNPQLNTREWFGNAPVRIVLDREGKIDPSYRVLDGTQPTLVITEAKKSLLDNRVAYQNCIFDGSLPQQIARILYQKGLQSVIIEGGAKTLQLFIDAGLWDEARVFESAEQWGQGIPAPRFEALPVWSEKIENNNLNWYYRYDQRNHF